MYAYPVEHYDYWQHELPDTELVSGIFGENFTIAGLLENQVNIGDRFKIGEVQLMVTQPRMPCYKLGIRFGRADIVKRFLHSQRTGFYFRVLQSGEVGADDELELIGRDKHNVTVADIIRLYVHKGEDINLLRRAIAVEALPASWRGYFQEQLDKIAPVTNNPYKDERSVSCGSLPNANA